jgi:hypothetical protein
VFVPEPAARSWHLGRTQVRRAREAVARYNRPFFADRIPYPRHWRSAGGPSRSVPLAEVVMAVGDQPLERVRAAVDSVLRGTEPDLRVNLVGPWDKLDGNRVPVLADPQLDLRLIAAGYRGEPRVRLVTEPPESAFPAPYLLELPVIYGLAPDTLRHLIDLADRHQAGVVHVNGSGGPALLWRTAAVSRARWVRSDEESMLDAVTSVHGSREVTAGAAGIVDLAGVRPRELARGVALRSRRPAPLAPSTVEVEGVRSWAKATAVVAWLAGRRLVAFLRFLRRSRENRRGSTITPR